MYVTKKLSKHTVIITSDVSFSFAGIIEHTGPTAFINQKLMATYNNLSCLQYIFVIVKVNLKPVLNPKTNLSYIAAYQNLYLMATLLFFLRLLIDT